MEDLRCVVPEAFLVRVQSGHMGRVGLGAILKCSNRQISKIKNGGVSLQSETELNLGLTAYIPGTILQMDGERLRWYKRLSLLRTSSPPGVPELD